MDTLYVLFDRVSYMSDEGSGPADSHTLSRGEVFPGPAKPKSGERERLVALGALGSSADLAATIEARRPTTAAAVTAAVEQQAANDAATAAEKAAVAESQGDTGGPSPDEAARLAAASTVIAAAQSAPGNPTAEPSASALAAGGQAPAIVAAEGTVEAGTAPAPAMNTTSDPGDFTVDAVNDYLTTATPEEVERVLAAEKAGKARKGIIGDA